MIAAAFLIGAVPAAIVLALAISGGFAFGTGFAALIVIGMASLAVAALWLRDLERFQLRVQRANDEAAELAYAPPPVSPTLRRVAREIESLSRTVASNVALSDQRRRADEALVEHLPDPLILLGADRAVRRANAAARRTHGPDLLALLRHPNLRAAIDRAFSSKTTQSVDLTIPASVMTDVRATVLFLEGGSAAGDQAVIVLSDRTRERAVERMRADFVANASHELRTPLTSLIGFIETLRGPASDDPPAQQRFLCIMAEQASRMSRLIDDLLSLSRIEMTEHQRPGDKVDVATLSARIAASFEPRLEEAGVTLEMTIAPALPPIAGDADQLAQIVQNLLDNAVKYGRSRGRVRLTAEPSASGGRWPAQPGVVISVADDGQGIPRRHLPRLTERFYRVDTGRSRAVGGTGLGLAIVKHVVNRHRGLLHIDSEEGTGTTVSVWLPEASSAERSLPALGAAQRG